MTSFAFEQKGNFKTLKVEFSSKYNRKPFPGDENDTNIENIWSEKRSKNPNVRLFNGMKFRLDGTRTTTKVNEESSSSLTLHLGLTDYKSHVGTNVRPLLEEENDFAQEQQHPYLAHALGVEACVLTSDDKIVLFRRSKHVSDFAGFYACPGGHAEPCRVFEKLSSVLAKNDNTHSPFLTKEKIDESVTANDLRQMYDKILNDLQPEHSDLIQNLIVQELYHSISEEVSSELGVPINLVKVESVLGLARATSPSQRGKPDLLFSVRLEGVTFEELQKKHFPSRQGDDAFEADDDSLLGIPVLEKLKNTSSSSGKEELIDWIKKNYNLTPPGRACVEVGIQQMF